LCSPIQQDECRPSEEPEKRRSGEDCRGRVHAHGTNSRGIHDNDFLTDKKNIGPRCKNEKAAGEAAHVEGQDFYGYPLRMNIDLSDGVESQLRILAERQGRDVRALAEEAIQQYLISAAITDLDSTDVAETQARLVGELLNLDEWKDTET
jgi:predicted transcriptional regulator